jgi:phosphoenolpyruvate carboxylase
VSRGLRVKEEDSFQGGEGYLPLFTPVAALATVRAALETVLADDPEAAGDPIYDDPDFASEFFATVEQDFARVVADPDYAALVGLFGTQLLPKTGSRPVRREREAGRPRVLASVSELRAIPNNAVLQQLGYLANTVFGVGHAAMKDPETFERMRRTSPRFRRALEMAAAAWRAGDLRAIEAYAATLDPALWLDRAVDDPEAPCDRAAARAAGEAGVSDPLNRFLKRLKAEDLAVREAFGPNALPKTAQRRRDRLLLLHALRAGAIQRLCLLAARVPEFSPQGPITRAGLLERLMRLDVPGALERLEEIFPKEPPAVVGDDDFGEPADYAPEEAHGHRDLHEQIFEPIARLYDLILRIGAGVTHDVGAFG